MAHDYTDAADLMRHTGGSFFKKIGEAFFLADARNQVTLVMAFHEDFDRYAALAREIKKARP